MLMRWGVFFTIFIAFTKGNPKTNRKYYDDDEYSKQNDPEDYKDESFGSHTPEYYASLQKPKPVEEEPEDYRLNHPSTSQARPQYSVPNIASNKQVQKAAAYLAGPQFVQEVQIAQQAAQANDAQTAAQRRAQAQAARQVQQYRAAQQPSYEEQSQQYANIQYVKPYYAATSVDPHYAREPSQSILQKPEEELEDYDHNPSYQFGFYVKDDVNTNYQNRKEQREGNTITGSYSVVDADGYLRTVKYTAHPKEGFKAEVIRKPTDIVVKVPVPYTKNQVHQKLEQTIPRQREDNEPKSKYVYRYQ